jgi:hypothetical protein
VLFVRGRRIDRAWRKIWIHRAWHPITCASDGIESQNRGIDFVHAVSLAAVASWVLNLWCSSLFPSAQSAALLSAGLLCGFVVSQCYSSRTTEADYVGKQMRADTSKATKPNPKISFLFGSQGTTTNKVLRQIRSNLFLQRDQSSVRSKVHHVTIDILFRVFSQFP